MSSSWLPFDEAREMVLQNVSRLPARPTPLADCLGLVLAQDVISQDNIPYRANSAMDGIAVIAGDLAEASPDSPITLRILETIEAGQTPREKVIPGSCSRIMTGAILPDGANAIVRVEDTEPSGESVKVKVKVATGADIRRAGEDIAAGEMALAAGAELRPYEIGLLAAVGLAEPLVTPRPRVAILATGSELVPVTSPLTPGKVRNSNAPALYAQCLAVGAIPVDFGIVEDTEEATEQALSEAVDKCDLVITSGAVSMGERDLIRPTMERLGEVVFWRVAMRPGSPLLFGRLRGKPCFCLPGNPTSTMLTFELFVRPALRKMMGHAAIFRPVERARAAEVFSPQRGLTTFIRGISEERDGEIWALKSGPQGSGMHKPFAHANCLVVLKGDASVPPGGDLNVIYLSAPESLTFNL